MPTRGEFIKELETKAQEAGVLEQWGELLNEEVHNQKSREASEINNNDEQLQYLLPETVSELVATMWRADLQDIIDKSNETR